MDPLGGLGSVLREEQERALAARAVAAGLLTADEAASGGNVEQLLRARNVPAERIERLRGQLDREDFALFRPDRRPPPEVLEARSDPQRRLAEFVLVTRLGQGGLGDVWKAWDTLLGRWVAIKLPRTPPDAEAAARRFTREALAAARLSHPNIVAVHRVAEEDGRCFIVMQLIDGHPLSAVRPPLREAVAILRETAMAVDHAHGQGVVHRDLKPGNIMIGPGGRPCVLDFGLAHLEEASWLQSREGMIAGTAAFMAPEQAAGGAGSRERPVDLYALGATLYHAVTGRAPFEGGSFADLLRQVLHEQPPLPREVNPSIPRDLEAVILKAMEKSPARRYGSAREFADDLDRWLRGDAVAALRASWSQTVRRQAHRYRRAVGAAGALSIGALLTAGVVWMQVEAREAQRRTTVELFERSLETLLSLRREADRERMSDLFQSMKATYRRAEKEMPEAPEIESLWGRFHRILGWEAAARSCQLRALEKDRNHLPAIYELIVLGERDHVPEGLDPARDRVARGIVASRRGEPGEAGHHLVEALGRDPYIEEAWEGLGRVWLAGVTAHSPPEVQEEAYRLAEEALTGGLDRDRGSLRLWEARAEVRMARAALRIEIGGDPELDFQGAEDDLAEAIRRQTVEPGARLRRGLLRLQMADYKRERGGNPAEDLRLAAADGVRLDPDATRDPVKRAEALVRRGEAGDLDEALRLLAPFVEPDAVALRARVRLMRGDLKGAVVDATRAIEKTAFFNGARVIRAAARRRLGVDLDAARADLAEVLRLNPLAADAWVERGHLEAETGRRLREAGDLPGSRAAFLQAVLGFEEALRIHPGLAAVPEALREARRGTF